MTVFLCTLCILPVVIITILGLRKEEKYGKRKRGSVDAVERRR